METIFLIVGVSFLVVSIAFIIFVSPQIAAQIIALIRRTKAENESYQAAIQQHKEQLERVKRKFEG